MKKLLTTVKKRVVKHYRKRALKNKEMAKLHTMVKAKGKAVRASNDEYRDRARKHAKDFTPLDKHTHKEQLRRMPLEGTARRADTKGILKNTIDPMAKQIAKQDAYKATGVAGAAVVGGVAAKRRKKRQ